MPNIKSAKKRVIRTKREAEENNVVYASMKTAIKKVEKAATKEEATLKLADAVKRIDKAHQKGVLKANTRDRYKKRLNSVVNNK